MCLSVGVGLTSGVGGGVGEHRPKIGQVSGIYHTSVAVTLGVGGGRTDCYPVPKGFGGMTNGRSACPAEQPRDWGQNDVRHARRV